MEKVSTGKIGRYEIIKVLGRGGMGEVILAQDENLGRKVAIKRPFKSAVAEGLARFQVEAKAATLRHPNIPAVYEMGVHDDLPFIAMEFVEGETLEKVIDNKRDIDLITKLRIIEQVCSALGYAHENGIIHRDIKPANIIVQPDGTAKIIDFGIAKLQDDDPNSGLTKASQLIGSLHYIAPERFFGGKVDGRADLFSAGVTLYKLLTGKEPFTGGEATASFKIMNESHTGLGAYLHDYPPVLDEIVAKSLAKNPDDRYQTGEDFADALHEITEDLKRTRVTELFGDAERLTTERRFAPALELLDEAIKLDPSHTQARKLRKFVREHQERIRRAERLRECLMKSDEALLSGNFDEALNQLKDALNLDSASEEVKSKIQAVEEKKRRFEISARALAEAERVKARGDITGALRIVTRALEEDPEHKKLLSLHAALQRQMEIEAQRGRLLELQEQATRALAARDWDGAERLLNDAAGIDPANADTDKLRRELSHARELEQRRAVLDEIQARVQEFIRTDNYEQAGDLLNRALDRLPNETLLHRLKAEVDAEARKYDVRRIVDMAIAQANELFANSPFEALAVVQKALESIPGEERLVSYERSLRQQLEARRSEQLRADTVLKARELMNSRQFEKAISVLETFQVEVGHHPDVDGLLAFAREELASQMRAAVVGRTLTDARNLIRDGRLDEAAALLDKAQGQTGDGSLKALLGEVREQQAAAARKSEALLKRVDSLRQRGELDEAIQVLQEQLAAAPGNANLQQLVNSLSTERKQKQTIAIAMRAAKEAVRQNDFAAALESLHTVVTAYGETPGVGAAISDVERLRAAHAGESVGKSIEAAQAALLNKDHEGALEALKSAMPFVDFADAQKQAEWQRIGQAVRRARQQAGATTGSHSKFEEQFSAIAGTKPRKTMLFVLGAVVLLVLAAVSFGVWKIAMVKPQASIEIQNITPGATVTIDSVEQKQDANGNVTLQVKAGVHHIVIAKEGFQPRDKSLDVKGPYTMDGTLYKIGEVLGKMQFQLPPGLAKVSVEAGGKSYEVSPDQPTIDLPVGVYPVTISAPGYQVQSIPSVPITQASASSPVTIPVNMQKIASGTLVIHLGGGATAATMWVNGKRQTGEVHPNQKVTLPEGTYAVRFEALGFKRSESSVRVINETETQVNVNLEKEAGPTGKLSVSQETIQRGNSATLSWQTQNVGSPQISGIGTVSTSGKQPVSPSATTTYVLSSNGQELDRTTIQVTEPPPPPPQLVTFTANPAAIDEGKTTTLSWQVLNATSVQISGVEGTWPAAKGSVSVQPSTKTKYDLSVNGVTIGSTEVTVRPAPPSNTHVVETPTIKEPAKESASKAELLKALNAQYLSIYQRASGQKTGDCQSVFNGAFGGHRELREMAKEWCPSAKSFTATLECSEPSPNPDTPTMACKDSVLVVPKDGAKFSIPGQKTFRFSKGADGNWQLQAQGW